MSCQHFETDKKEHVAGEAKEENKVDATCTEDGSYDLVTYCEVCGTELSRVNNKIDKTSHTPDEWQTVTEASATQAGKKVKKCKDCGTVLEEETIPATGSGSSSGGSGSGGSSSGSGSGSGSSGSSGGSGSSGSGSGSSSGTGSGSSSSGSGSSSSGSGSGTGTGTGTGSGTDTSTGTGTSNGTDTTKENKKEVKVGDIITDPVSKAEYKVTAYSKKKHNVEYVSYVGKSKKVNVPASITVDNVTYKVIRVAANAFKKNVTKITIEDGVKYISKGAFSGCSKLKSLVIRTKLLTTKTVAKGAFIGLPATCKVYVSKDMKAAYTELFKAKGLSEKIKIANYKK